MGEYFNKTTNQSRVLTQYDNFCIIDLSASSDRKEVLNYEYIGIFINICHSRHNIALYMQMALQVSRQEKPRRDCGSSGFVFGVNHEHIIGIFICHLYYTLIFAKCQ